MKAPVPFAAMLFLIAGCGEPPPLKPSSEMEQSARHAFDLNACYPYIVPEAYLPFQPDDGKGLVRPVGHRLFALLVQDQTGSVQNVTPDDLEAAKMTAEAAHAAALSNLQQLFSSGQIKPMKYDHGPNGQPFIVFGQHWAASACLLLPEMRRFAQKHLGGTDFVASIPHRDVLLIFPKPNGDQWNAIRSFVIEHESEGRKPLTFELFELTESGTVPGK